MKKQYFLYDNETGEWQNFDTMEQAKDSIQDIIRNEGIENLAEGTDNGFILIYGEKFEVDITVKREIVVGLKRIK